MRSEGAARDARQYGDTRPGRLGAAEQVPGTGAVLGGRPRVGGALCVLPRQEAWRNVGADTHEPGETQPQPCLLMTGQASLHQRQGQ